LVKRQNEEGEMQRFKNILFVTSPTTESESAFARAVRLARTNKATLTVVSVQREIERNMPSLQVAISRHQQDRLKELIRTVDTKGVKISTRAMIGTTFLEVIREVVAGSHDLLMKPAEGRGGMGRWLFGSTDWHLMRKCPCPVWIMKPSKRQKYSRLLAAVDPAPGDKANEDLNNLILSLATSLAAMEGSKLHIVHAWSVPNENLMRSGRARMSPAEVNRFVRETKEGHKDRLSELLAKHDLADIPNRIHLLKGDPADVIADVARMSKVDLVVMGSVVRTGIPGFFIGNTAEKTLGDLNCSVLTVKPKDFVTPIQP
jgi:nucleotide-binding universal stress UspA family protein